MTDRTAAIEALAGALYPWQREWMDWFQGVTDAKPDAAALYTALEKSGYTIVRKE